MRLYEGEVDRCVGWRTYEYWDSHTVVSRTKAASEIPQTTMNSASSCPGCHTVCKRAHRGNGPNLPTSCYGSFATDPFSASADQCPLCATSRHSVLCEDRFPIVKL